MRAIKIVLENYEYTVGDLVEGNMIVVCDKSFKCKRIHLTFAGTEHVRVYVRAGDHIDTVANDRVHFEEHLDFDRSGEMQPGEHIYPFSFRIPEDIPSSCRGHGGYNDYTLSAKVEISWAKDLKEEATITIRRPFTTTTSEGRRTSTEREGATVLEIDLERDVLCIGDDMRFKVRVARGVKIRGLCVELISQEISKAKRRTFIRDLIHQKIEIDNAEIPRDKWYNMVMKTDSTMLPWFKGEILQLLTILKVTLDVPWIYDTWVEIPLKFGHCQSSIETDEFEGTPADAL